MKRFVLALLLIVTVVQADPANAHTRLPYKTAMALLEGISQDAIVLGTGRTDVYVFVDPLCPHSRKFITMVSQNGQMLSKYRYHVYLYSIPRLRSQTTVAAIFASAQPEKSLLQVMVGHEGRTAEPTETTQKRVEAIAEVARKMDVYKRPYLIVALRP